MNRQTITVDIAPGNSQVQRLSSAQGDIGRPLGVYIIQDGVALDCSGYTADLYILKSDGNYYEGTATVDSQTNNLITWETAEQETPCAGVCAAQIRISANGEDIGTARFVEYVEASPGFVGEGSESTIDTIKGFVRQAEAWATGEKDGIPVSSTDPTYENNAKYYAEQSKQDYDDLAAEINDISDDVDDLKTGMSDLEDAVSAQSIICDTPSLPIVTITDGADGQPMKSVTVDLEPVQEGTGDPAPDNVRPISGHTQAVVTRTGVNAWDGATESGGINTSGAETTTAGYYRTKNYIQVIGGADYYFKLPVQMNIFWYDCNKTFISYSSALNQTKTAPDNACYLRFRNATANSWTPSDTDNISINYPATDTDYHPGHVQSVTIPLGNTYYGGTLDAVAGTLTVDRAIVDLGTLTWSKASYSGSAGTWDYFVTSSVDRLIVGDLVCSAYAFTGSGAVALTQNCSISRSGSNKNIFARDDAYSVAADFKTAVSGVQLAYYIATPQTYTLTPQEITTLLGVNNVFSDSGDVQIEYQADTKLYIDKAGQTEDDMTANATIASGQYFQIGTTVYKATATILTGEQIIPGTNCVQTTTTEALNILMAGQPKQWELIREDTFTNATSADHTITADSNSQPFELTDAIVLFETPKQATASEVGSYGQIRFYPTTSGTNYYAAECGAWTQAANSSAHGIMGMLEQRDGLIFLTGTQQVTSSNSANLRMRYGSGFTGSSQGIWMASDFTIQRIVIPAVTGTGHYKLFGKRK